MSFGGHRVVPFTHAYRGPGIGAAFKGVAERTPTIGDANVAAWQHHVKMMHSHSQASMKTLTPKKSASTSSLSLSRSRANPTPLNGLSPPKRTLPKPAPPKPAPPGDALSRW